MPRILNLSAHANYVDDAILFATCVPCPEYCSRSAHAPRDRELECNPVKSEALNLNCKSCPLGPRVLQMRSKLSMSLVTGIDSIRHSCVSEEVEWEG